MKFTNLLTAALLPLALLGCAHTYEVGVEGVPEKDRAHVSYANPIHIISIDGKSFTSFSGGLLATNGDTHDISLSRGFHTFKVTYASGSGMVSVSTGAVELSSELLAGHRYQIIAMPVGNHLRLSIKESAAK